MPIRELYTFNLQYPQSTTYRMPSTVRDVSAMFVATITCQIRKPLHVSAMFVATITCQTRKPFHPPSLKFCTRGTMSFVHVARCAARAIVITLRAPPSALSNIFACSSDGSSEYTGKTEIGGNCVTRGRYGVEGVAHVSVRYLP